MRRDIVNYTLVGAVVLAAIVVLLVGLALITGRSGATTGYVVRYRNVTGLRYGAPVFYQGYRVGEVGGITPERGYQILAGAILLRTAMKVFDVPTLTISPWALREGIVLRYIDALDRA